MGAEYVTIEDLLPTPVCKELEEFIEQHKTGSITLNFKDGQCLTWAITEHGRVYEKTFTVPVLSWQETQERERRYRT